MLGKIARLCGYGKRKELCCERGEKNKKFLRTLATATADRSALSPPSLRTRSKMLQCSNLLAC